MHKDDWGQAPSHEYGECLEEANQLRGEVFLVLKPDFFGLGWNDQPIAKEVESQEVFKL